MNISFDHVGQPPAQWPERWLDQVAAQLGGAPDTTTIASETGRGEMHRRAVLIELAVAIAMMTAIASLTLFSLGLSAYSVFEAWFA
jgi:hypothetical protein